MKVFDGQTLISLFADNLQFIHLLSSLLNQGDKLEDTTDWRNRRTQNLVYRKLHKILTTPIDDNLLLTHLDEKTEFIGKRNLLQEALHFSGSKYIESLIEVALNCEELSLPDLCMHMHDLQPMILSSNPAHHSLLEKCFQGSHQLDQIVQLRMPEEETQMIIRRDNTIYDRNNLQTDLNDEGECDTIKEVSCRFLNLRCVYESWQMLEDDENVIQLCKLFNDPDPALFKLDFIKIMMSSVWPDCSAQISKSIFAYFVLELFFFNLYCYLIALQDVTDESLVWDFKSFEFYIRWIVLGFSLYFLYVEE